MISLIKATIRASVLLTLFSFLIPALVVAESELFWSSSYQGSINSIRTDGTGRENHITFPGSASFITPNPSDQKAYWLVRDWGEIRRSNYDGSEQEVVAEAVEGMEFFIDSARGYMYYSIVRDESYKLVRKSLSDSSIQEIVDLGDSTYARHFQADPENNFVIFDVRELKRLNLATATVTDIVVPDGYSSVRDIVAVLEGKIYWTSNGTTLYRINLDGSTREVVFLPGGFLREVRYVPELEKFIAVIWDRSDGSKEVVSINIDGSGELPIVGNELVTEFVYNPVSKKLVFVEHYYPSSIKQVDLDGSNMEVLATAQSDNFDQVRSISTISSKIHDGKLLVGGDEQVFAIDLVSKSSQFLVDSLIDPPKFFTFAEDTGKLLLFSRSFSSSDESLFELNLKTKESKEKIMHDIDKPITLEDLTNPDKD